MKKRFTFILTLTALLCLGTGNIYGQSYTKTCSNGDDLSQYAPVYGLKASNYIFTQIIYPSSELTTTSSSSPSIKDYQITKMTFYVSSTNKPTNTWSNMQVRLKEISKTAFSSNSDWQDYSDATLVYDGILDATSGTMVINFTTPYVYKGGQLLVDVRSTAKNTNSTKCKFYAYYNWTTTQNTVLWDYNSTSSYYSGTRDSYRPKVTFTYEEAAAPEPSSCAAPTDLDVPAAYITVHGAKVTWTMGEAVSSTLEYKLNSASADAWAEASTDNTSGEYTFTSGLLASTKYDVRVKNICSEDESAYTSTVSFTTACDAKSVPYSIGFETSEGCTSGAYAPCWEKIGTPAVIANSGYTTYAKTGTQALRFNGSTEQYIILPQFAQEVKNLSLTFWYKHYYYTYYASNLEIGSMTDPADKNTFTPLKALTQTNDYLQVEDYDLTGAPAGDYYIAFKYTASSSSAAVMLDDVQVKQASTCKKPASLTATAASATSINLSWTAKGEETAWQVQYRIGSGSWSSPINASTNPFTLEDLTAQTTYEIQVRANCGSEQSDWSASAEATTDCAAKSIPWTCGFEVSEGYTKGTSSSGAPECWKMSGANAGDYPYIYVNNSPDFVKSGSYSLYSISSGSKDAYLIFPAFNAPLNSLQIEFYHKEEDPAKSNTIILGYVTDAENPASSFVTLVGPFTRYDEVWTKVEESLASVPAGVANTARLAFKIGKGSSSNWYLGIDDILVSELPACPKPVLTATNIIYNGATINWADGSSENKWKLQYKASGDSEWSDANGGALIAASSFNLTGLTSGTTYQVQAQAECEGAWSNAVSFVPTCVTPSGLTVSSITTNTASVDWTVNSGENEWNIQYKKSTDGSWTTVSAVSAHPYVLTGLTPGSTYQVKVAATCNGTYTSAVSFDTECAAITTLPWNEGFEGLSTGSYSSAAPLCWAQIGVNNGYGVYPQIYVNTSSSYVKSGSKSLYMVSNATVPGYIILPEFDAALNTLQISFWHKSENEGESGKITVGYITDVADAGTFHEIEVLTRSTSWQYATVKLNNVPVAVASTARIALRYGGSLCTNNYYAGVDDITVEVIPNCSTPSSLSLVADPIGTNTATVYWTKSGDETAWKLQYMAESDADWSAEQSVATTPSFDMSGLAENTLYFVRVKADCGGGSESEYTDGSFSFRTNCVDKTLDWTESVTATTKPLCWTIADGDWGSYQSQWSASTTQKYAGTYSFRYYAKKSFASDKHSMTTPAIELSKPAILKFFYRNRNTNSGTYAVQMDVKVLDASDDSELITESITDVTGEDAWATKIIDLTAHDGKTVKVVFTGYGVSVNKDAYLYVDEVQIIEKPCDVPTELAAAATSTGAVVTWTAGGAESQWNLQYRENAEPENSWTPVENVTSGYEITGLQAGHYYEVQVQAYCDATHQSAWTASANFSPVCGAAPTALTVSARTTNSATLTWEGAESAFKLQTSLNGEDWESAVDVNAKTYNLTGLNAGTTYYARVQNACGGEYASASFTTWCDMLDAAELPLEISNFTTVPECWQATFKGEYSGVAGNKINFYGTEEQMLVLPCYDINLNKLSVTFNYSVLNATVQFGYIDEPNGTFYAFTSQPANGEELNLESEAAAPKYIAVSYSGAGEFSYIQISGVQLRKTPTCLKPTDVTVVEDVDQATVSWTSTATAWNLQYKLASAAAWQDATGTITNPFTLSGLEQGTSYKVRVQAACAGEDLSDWSDEASFTTSCAAVTAIPYTETFDGALSNCWNVTDDETSVYAHNVYGGELRLPGGKAASGHLVVLPEITASLANATMTIEYTATSGANTATPQVGYIDGESAFHELGTLSKSNSATTAFVALAAADGHRLALRYDDGTSEGDFNIREVRVSHVEIFEDSETANNNVSRLEALSGQTIDAVFERPILRNGDYNTLCLPFGLSAAQLADSKCPLNGFEVRNYDHSDVDVNNDIVDIYLRTVGSIEAGKACFVRLEEGTLDRLTMADFRDVTIKTSTITPTDDNESGIHYIGIFDPHELVGNNSANLYLSTDNALYIPASNTTMKGFRAYFGVDAGGPASAPIRRGAQVRIVEHKDSATGINAISTGHVQAEKRIENNQVIIIRNGIKYTVQGQMIQ